MAFIASKFYDGSQWVDEVTSFASKKEGSTWEGIMGRQADVVQFDETAKPEEQVLDIIAILDKEAYL